MAESESQVANRHEHRQQQAVHPIRQEGGDLPSHPMDDASPSPVAHRVGPLGRRCHIHRD